MASDLSEVLLAHDIMEPVVCTCGAEDRAIDMRGSIRFTVSAKNKAVNPAPTANLGVSKG